MNLVHFNPFKEMDSLFSRFRNDMNGDFNLQSFTQSDWVPPVDINESDKDFGKPLVSYTPESVTITQSEEYRYERKTLSRRI